MVVLRPSHRLASAALAVLLLPLAAATPEVRDPSEATVFVDGSTDYFEFSSGALWGVGNTWDVIAPDGRVLTLTKTAALAGTAPTSFYLDGTPRAGNTDQWTASASLDGAAADGTWTLVAPASWYNSHGGAGPTASPGPTLAVQGKAISFGVWVGPGQTSQQLWNWHRTTGTWTEPSTLPPVSTTYDDPVDEGPEEDPQYARFFAETVGPQSQSVPGASDSETVPAQDVDTPPFTIPATCTLTQCTVETPLGSTPPVTLPATCTVAPCTSETPLVTPAQPVPETCVPPLVPLLCVGPFTVPALDLGDAPAICATVGVVCLGPIPIPSQDLGSAPAVCDAAGEVCVGPFPVPAQDVVETEDITVAVDFTGLDAAADAHAGEIGSIGPIVEVVPVPLIGDVPLTLCPATCPFPVLPEGETVGNVTVTVTVGDEEESVTIPLGASV